MPAQGRSKFIGKRRLLRQNRIQNTKKRNIVGIYWKFAISLVILLCMLAFIKFGTKEWNGKDKIGFVFPDRDGSVKVVAIDPERSEMTTIIIPGDTEVEVAGGYGTFRLKNVWQIGLNEKRDGDILAKTITRNFLFPVYLWSGYDTGGIYGKFPNLLHFIFSPSRTNITFGDRLAIAMFVLKVKNIEKTEINLADGQFVKKSVLNDGLPGFRIAGTSIDRLTTYFGDNFSEENLRFGIVDVTGGYGNAPILGKILEVMGGKVVAVDRGDALVDMACVVSGENSIDMAKVSKVFGCEIKKSKTDFDMEIKIGKNFAKTF